MVSVNELYFVPDISVLDHHFRLVTMVRVVNVDNIVSQSYSPLGACNILICFSFLV